MTTPAASEPVPDVRRLGGLEWTRRAGGKLSGRERRRLLRAVVRTQAVDFAHRILSTTRFAAPRGADLLTVLPAPPDSAFARAAEEACDEQAPQLIGHGYRSWIYGAGLATLDRVTLDPELFYAACLLHDYGLTSLVPGEEFTLRGAARAELCGRQTDVEPHRITAVADAITVHLTPGITASRDGTLGTYVQAGALLDLVGNRAGDLPRQYRGRAKIAHPPIELAPAVINAIRNETKANPGTRLTLLNRCGLTHLIRISTGS